MNLGYQGDRFSVPSLYQSVTRSAPYPYTCTSSTSDVEWRYIQAFGDDNSSDDDFVTTVEFDPTGNYVAVGDKAGRMCLFEASSLGTTQRSVTRDYLQTHTEIPYPRKLSSPNPLHQQTLKSKSYLPSDMSFLPDEDNDDETAQYPTGEDYENYYYDKIQQRVTNSLLTTAIGQQPNIPIEDGKSIPNTLPRSLEYRFYSEFQSHDIEFDSLKSSEILGTINAIKWVESTPTSQTILATNDKTIKLWRLYDKQLRSIQPVTTKGGTGEFVLPKTAAVQPITIALRKNVYANGHAYYINSISPSCDGRTFVSSDDVRLHLWDYEYPLTPFNVIDLRPPVIEEITEVITSASLHPFHPHLMIYSSSRGCIRLLDLRDGLSCDHQSRNFDLEDDPVTKSFFTEITASISDTKFTPNGQYIIARDFGNVHVWDIRNENKPIASFGIHDHLRLYLSELYEYDTLFDRFKLSCSPDGTQVLSGSYNNQFSIHNWNTGQTLTFECGAKLPRRKTKMTKSNTKQKAPHQRKSDRAEHLNMSLLNLNRKALHLAWHPLLDCVAVAGVNKLYIYEAFPSQLDNGMP